MFTARRNMGSSCQGKSSWPELVYEDAQKAVAKIEAENPSVKAVIINENASVIQNFVCNRVWVRVNCDGRVSETPKIG